MKLRITKLNYNSSTFKSYNNNIILLIIGGQSNVGTDPATGRIPYTNMPDLLKQAYTNVYSYQLASGFPTGFTLYQANSGREMGWLDYLLYRLSLVYKEVYFVKRGLGGSILGTGGTLYPKSEFINKANSAITMMNSSFGVNNYKKVFLWGQGETDALTQTNADNYESNLSDWFTQMRTDVGDYPIIFNSVGDLQVTDFPFVSTVQQAQINNVSERNLLVTTGKAELLARFDNTTPYTLRDYSHFNAEAAQTIGIGYVNKLVDLLSFPLINNDKPLLISAEIDNSNPYQIILTFDKSLASIYPRKEAFTITPYRTIFENNYTAGAVEKTITISNNKMYINVAESFYTTDDVTLVYSKANNSASNIQGVNGQEIDDFEVSVTNGSAAVTSGYTNIKTYDWSAGLDGWAATAALTATGGVTYEGKTNCVSLEVVAGGTQQFYAASQVISAGTKYVYSFEEFVPVNVGFKQYQQLALSEKIPNPVIFIERTYQIKRGEWVKREIEFTSASTTARPQIELTGLLTGKTIYIRNFQINRVN